MVLLIVVQTVIVQQQQYGGGFTWASGVPTITTDAAVVAAAADLHEQQHHHRHSVVASASIEVDGTSTTSTQYNNANDNDEEKEQIKKMGSTNDDDGKNPTTTTTVTDIMDGSSSSSSCGLYLAPSTLPNAGLGVFSAIEKQKGDTIAEGDICLPFVDMYMHNEEHFFPNPFRDYFWVGKEMGMASESDSEDIEAYCPGLDCAVNCNPALLNVKKVIPQYDEAGLHRSKHPGAGARTPYHNGTSYVGRHIPVGGELFKDYGQNWFDYRYGMFGDFPMHHHYEEATEVLGQVFTLQKQYELGDDVMTDLYKILTTMKPIHPSQRGIKPTSRYVQRNSAFHSRVLNALPDRYEDAKKAFTEYDGDITELHQPAATQSIEFLQQNGKCIDNIRPKRSTIEGAGNGAFATRFLPEGTVITASPLHHVNKSFANMYQFIDDPKTGEPVRTNQIVGYQIMLNYCYNHPNSTLLLCPYGAGINYINHGRGTETPTNVKIRWATNFPLAHNQSAVEHGSFDMFHATEKQFLAFDYVATRDIQEGEEMFLDYGDAWVDAWEKHVASWEPPKDAEKYASARYMNANYPHSVLRTLEEQQHDPHPFHLDLRCHDKLLTHRVRESYTWTLEEWGYSCNILERKILNNVILYDVVINLDRYSYEHSGKQRVVQNVPRSAIAFFDVPFSTDFYLRKVFRHPIGIPDGIFPKRWKNLL